MGRLVPFFFSDPRMRVRLQVSVQPLLPALTVDAIPESLVQHTGLSSVLPDGDWDSLRKAAYRRAGYKCAS